MSAYPSFVYDQHRPGVSSKANAKIWRDNREKLEGLIHGSTLEVGAAILKLGLGGAATENTTGDATVLQLSRQEPPMTADGARLFGNMVVAV